MSLRSRGLPRRSCLSVPGLSARMIEKAQGLAADMVLLDLEDSVPPSEKVSARARVAEVVRDGDWGERVVGVRVNDWSTPWTLGDLSTLVLSGGERLDTVILPKVEDSGMVRTTDLVLAQIEQEAGLKVGHVGIEVQIETARGVMNVEEICGASPRLEAVILGPVDLAASLEMPTPDSDVQPVGGSGDPFGQVLFRLLVAGRANDIQVIDGPHVKIADLDGLRETSRRSQQMGLDGRWALHPTQIDILNEVFSPTQGAFDRALGVIEAYHSAITEDRRGAVMFDGEMIDEATRKVALKLVDRGQRAGMERSAG